MQVREALLPHLAATMRMRWDNPPDPIPAMLGRLPEPRETAASPELEAVARYCGREATWAMRQAASAGESLTYARMREVQRLVTGPEAARFRDGTARTQIRPERYAYLEDLPRMFRRKVAVDDRDGCAPLIKAVRLYLDVIFFHPFVDGNARAATLWFTFHCLRAGLPTPDFRRFHGFGFVPGDERTNWRFCRLAVEETIHG